MDLHAACTAEEAARAKCLLKVGTLRVEKAAQNKRIEELMRRLAEELSPRERTVAEMGYTEDAINVKAKLTEQV